MFLFYHLPNLNNDRSLNKLAINPYRYHPGNGYQYHSNWIARYLFADTHVPYYLRQ